MLEVLATMRPNHYIFDKAYVPNAADRGRREEAQQVDNSDNYYTGQPVLGQIGKAAKSSRSVLRQFHVPNSIEDQIARVNERTERFNAQQAQKIAALEAKRHQNELRMLTQQQQQLREQQLMERERLVQNSESERQRLIQELRQQFNDEVNERVNAALVQRGLLPNVIRNQEQQQPEPVIRAFQAAAIDSDDDDEERKDQVGDNEQSMDGIVLNNAISGLRLQNSASSVKTRSYYKNQKKK